MQNTQLARLLVSDQTWRDEHLSDDEYLVRFRDLPVNQTDFSPAFDFAFPIPDFSNKIRFCERTFSNAAVLYLNKALTLLDKPDPDRIAFQFKKHSDRTRIALNAYYIFLLAHRPLLDSLIDGSCPDFSSDLFLKESVTLAYFYIWRLIWCNMELQNLFYDYIRPDNRLSVNDHFTRLLRIPPFSPPCVTPIADSEAAQHGLSSAPENPSLAQLAASLPGSDSVLTESYKFFLEKLNAADFYKLPKVCALPKENLLNLIDRMMNGETPFRFALVYFLGWPQWLYEHTRDLHKKKDLARFFSELFHVGLRQAMGYLNVLMNSESKEDREVYNAPDFLKDADDFYCSLFPQQA